MFPKIRIESLQPHLKTVYIDNAVLNGVHEADVRLRVDEIATVTLEVYPDTLDLILDDCRTYLVIGDKKYILTEVEKVVCQDCVNAVTSTHESGKIDFVCLRTSDIINVFDSCVHGRKR